MTETQTFASAHRARRQQGHVARAVVALIAVVAGLTIPTTPASAGETALGPCTIYLDYPHGSTTYVPYVGTQPVVRVHTRFICASGVIYVSAEVTIRKCLDGIPPDPYTCRPEGEDAQTKPTPTPGLEYRNFTTSDTPPVPDSGIYVATASYRVCPFNSPVINALAVSEYVQYDASTNKAQVLKKGIDDIIGN